MTLISWVSEVPLHFQKKVIYHQEGQKFDIHGTSGHIYNIISTPTFQMNAMFLNYPLIKVSDATWFSVVGMKVIIAEK